MIKRLFGSLLLSALLCGLAFAHSGKPKFNLVIDTDGAIDDMRAISMFLSGNDIRVLGITCSQGTLLPDSVFVKVNSLLSAFHHEGIPVGIGEEAIVALPVWSPFAQKIRWGNKDDLQDSNLKRKSKEILDNTFKYCQDKITLIALGSLKTYADWIRANQSETGQIERIIWYNNRQIKEGYNYTIDPDSYEYIRKSGISIEVVCSNSDPLAINEEYLNQIHNIHSIYANQIERVHSQPSVKERVKNNHLKLWDDLVPLYLTAPVLFEVRNENNIRFASINQSVPVNFVYETIGILLVSATTANNRIFIDFPVDTALYKPAYASMLNETIGKFGLIEWKAISMTNEIHGHTGIYSIIGAKMGIRAMEYYNVGVNNMKVTTFAGSKPPLSCFNDGIQISTGATIGQGLITISDSLSITPSAIFEFNNQKVHIAVKPEIAQQMRNEIKYGVDTYGLLSDRYWIYIEKLAIEYWANFDRSEIFVIEKL
jgi:inosine-uridine nucleoside N-ribohydrolase